MSRLARWLLAGIVLLRARRQPRPSAEAKVPTDPRGELLATLFFVLSAVCAGAFIAVHALDRLPAQTQLPRASLRLSLALLAAARPAPGQRVLPAEGGAEAVPAG